MTSPEPETTLDRDALQYILSMPRGRKVIWDLLAFAGLFRQPRVPSDSDGTAFNCGSLNVGLMLYADCLTVSPEHTAMMTKEQASYDNRDSNDARTSERSDSAALGNTDSGRPEQPGPESKRPESRSAIPSRGSLPGADDD